LVVNGEQGTGKSFFCRLIRALIDPRAAPNRGVPKEDRDLVVSAGKSWVLAFDNLSSVPLWLSDALCRLASGTGFATRTLHSDRDETIFDAARPIILNGIPSLTDRPDLADRTVTIHLRPIADEDRRSEEDLSKEFEKERPLIIGALLNGVRSAIENVAAVHIERLPRMADFAKFATAAEHGLGWDKGAFLKAYQANRNDVSDATFEADTVAVAVHKLVMSQPDGVWRGTATELLAAINAAKRAVKAVGEPSSQESATELLAAAIKASRRDDDKSWWPRNPQAMGNHLDRIAPLLRNKRIAVHRHHSEKRTITLTWLDAPDAPAPELTM
jgi:putative DNA primase/helicase